MRNRGPRIDFMQSLIRTLKGDYREVIALKGIKLRTDESYSETDYPIN